MVKIIKNYLKQNLFYVSVIITGMVSLFTGMFYAFFKNKVFEKKLKMTGNASFF